MNIFTVLFGRKKIENKAQKSNSYDIYIKSQLKSVGLCCSVSELTEYAKDYSGYIREAAINRCVVLATPDVFPLVVSRLNDWVPEIRRIARVAVMTLMPFAGERQLLDTLPTIIRLIDIGKGDLVPWVEEYERNFLRFVTIQAMKNALVSDNRKVSRASFYMLSKHKALDTVDIVGLVISSKKDIVIATQTVNICSALPSELQEEQYLKAAKSTFGSVRTIAIQKLLSLDFAFDKSELAISALLDVQFSVRYIAADYLKGQEFDLRGFYTCQLQKIGYPVKKIQVSLISLANFGNLDDLTLIKSFTYAQQPVLRKTAFFCWLKMDGSAKDLIAHKLLMDEASSMRKCALQIVRKYGAHISFKIIYETLLQKRHFDLLLEFSKDMKWNWIECIARLFVYQTNDSNLRIALINHLGNWIDSSGNSFEKPSQQQLDFLRLDSTKSMFYDLLGNDSALCLRLDFELAQEFR